MATMNTLGSFSVQSNNYAQDITLDDLTDRFNLSFGTVATTETRPLWGGLLVVELLPGNQSGPRGSTTRRAVSVVELEGFTVFNQVHSGPTTPQSPTLLYASGMGVSFYRLGSNMHVPLEASTQAITLAISDASMEMALAWDSINNRITTAAVAGSAGADTVTTALTYVSGMATATTASARGLMAGQCVKISGVTPPTYNDTVVVLSVPSATTFAYAPTTTPGDVATTQGIIGAVAPFNITLPVRVLAVEVGSSKIVTYDSSTGLLTQNNNDSCALVLP